jgi:hypothetical protein
VSLVLGGVIEIVFRVEAAGKSLEASARSLPAGAPPRKAAYSPSMMPSGTATTPAR